MAAACHRQLDIDRGRAAKLGHSAVKAAQDGRYTTPDGHAVAWGDLVQAARAAKVSIPPDETLPDGSAASHADTIVQVANETTLQASRRMVERGLRPLALNFANGIYPGGGFRNGALAQEENLCRSSALYLTLEGDPMYAAHRKRELPDSTDWAILSPDVPVFRDDGGAELERPWLLSFVTCAAPVVSGVGQPLAATLLKRRIGRVLSIARAFRYDVLVLGAWGCGAFKNDPLTTARDFRQALETGHAGAFSEVVFAITDWSAERRFLGPFRDELR
jgi:uncharacterized protein (TIGR02452 family)